MKIVKQFELSSEDIEDILFAAFQGIAYWAEDAQTTNSPYFTIVETDTGKVLTVDESNLQKGLQMWLDSNPSWDGELGMIDAEAGDMIIQYAVFGELVYG